MTQALLKTFIYLVLFLVFSIYAQCNHEHLIVMIIQWFDCFPEEVQASKLWK